MPYDGSFRSGARDKLLGPSSIPGAGTSATTARLKPRSSVSRGMESVNARAACASGLRSSRRLEGPRARPAPASQADAS